jgi:hypothetical protein
LSPYVPAVTENSPRRRRTRLAAAALALSSLVGVATASTPAGANHSWGGYHWARTSNPFTLQLGDNVTSVWDGRLAETSADWSKSSVVVTPIITGTSNPKNCRATAGTVQVCNSKYGGTGWLGVASIWASGGHITQGTVKLNDTYFNTAKYNTTAWRNLVSCQEVGHTLGLDHQDENFDNTNLDTCMDYTNDPLSNQHPNAHDYAQLESIYAHLEPGSASSSSSSSANASAGESRADWGRAVHQDADGRDDHFVRELGHGDVIVSFVIWAD